jgi:tartrate dehydrogenase/decarboxylase / D-malate dehydrogenase
MATHTIAVLGGDGIGPEVIAQAVRAVEAAVAKHDRGHALRLTHLPWGSEYYKKHGHILPADGWDTLAKHDAILFGAVGDPSIPDTIPVHQLLLPMRRRFDQYVNLRPAYLFDGVPCPLVGKAPGSIDMMVYRENTEGEYAPVGGKLYPDTDKEVAVQTSVFTRAGCERILRAAFEGARKRPRKKLTSITKSNACGTRPTRRCGRTSRTCSRTACWWTRRRWTSCGSRRRSTWWWRATCSATS